MRKAVLLLLLMMSPGAFAQVGREQKVVLITGVSRGIGKAVAERFSSDSRFSVFGTVRDKNLDGSVVSSASGPYQLVHMDVTDTRLVESAVSTVVARAGGVDVLINNAGYVLIGSIESIDIDSQMKALFDVNVFGYSRTLQAVTPYMRANFKGGGYGGRVINISSTQGVDTSFYMETYGATKAAIETLSTGQAAYLKDHCIDVLVYEPKATDTDILRKAEKGSRKVEGDTWLQNHQALHDMTMERLASGMTVRDVADEIYDLVLQERPDFRTPASQAASRVEKVFIDASGNSKRDAHRKKYETFVNERVDGQRESESAAGSVACPPFINNGNQKAGEL